MNAPANLSVTNLPLGSDLGEFIGLEVVGTSRSLKRFTRESVIGTIEAVANSFTVGGGVIFTTLAQANANLAFDADQMAWVIQDATVENNGVYQKQGASGTGSWSRLGDLPYSFYRAHNVGSGTANAIQATNEYPLASADALVILPIVATNTTSPVTVSFNGASALTIKTAAGNDVAPGGLIAGMTVGGFIDGTEFRLITDQASAAIQSAAEAAQAAAEAARDIATGAMSSFFENFFTVKAVAEAYSPAAGPDSIAIQGYDTVGDGGDGLYKKNGTTTGDIILTLSDGSTKAGYTLQRDRPYRPQQTSVIGNVDDRAAFQSMLDRLQDGDVLEFPGWAAATIVNGSATGATVWAQRADAVANGGLRALTCDKDDITLVINGTITMTTALDDLFRLSGKRVRVTGRGLLQYSGAAFVDTNAQTDATKQWLPSLICLTGAYSGVEGLQVYRPPSVGIRLAADRQYAFKNRIYGGPTTYQPNGNDNGDYRDNGTVLFGIYMGLPNSTTLEQKAFDNMFHSNGDGDGGQLYDSIFCTNTRGKIGRNHHSSCWEHGVYSYGPDVEIVDETIVGAVSNGIQAFAAGSVIRGCRIENCGGGIQFKAASNIQAIANNLQNNGTSGISVRTYPGDAADLVYKNIMITDNIVSANSATVASGIDIYLDNPFDTAEIGSNIIEGATTGTNAGILVGCSPTAASRGLRAHVHDNTVKSTSQYAIAFFKMQDFDCKNNRVLYANGESGEAAIYGSDCAEGCVDGNNVSDGRSSPSTSLVADFTSAGNNTLIRARDNELSNGAGSSGDAVVSIPAATGSWSRDNTRDGVKTTNIG